METALRRIAEMLEAFSDAATAWFATGAWRPEAWPGVTWALVGAFVVLSWLLAWRRRAPRALDVRPPQLLVTSGEVVPDGAEDAGFRPSGRRRRRVEPEVHAAAGTFSMTVSNLSRYPVQLLEVALRDARRGAPRVASVEAVVPAMGSVTVAGRVPLGLRGDGWLDLYCYAAAPRVKMHRHRVELVWEPWAARFKVAPLEQMSVPARRLAGDEQGARFLEDEQPEPPEPAFVAPPRAGRVPERRDAPAAYPVPVPTVDRPKAVPAHESARPARGSTAPAPVAPVRPAPAPEGSGPGRSAASAPPPRTPIAPAPPAARPGAKPPAARPSAPLPAAPPSAKPRPASDAVAAPRSASVPTAPSGSARPANPTAEPEPRGVPRIATPPLGVAVNGRGGASTRTAEGLPIGRPTVRPEPTPIAPAAEPVRGPVREPGSAAAAEPASARAPEPVAPSPPPSVRPRDLAPDVPPARPAADAPVEHAAPREDEPPTEAPARRRPRLEFPDEF